MDTSYLFDNAISDKRLQIMKTALPYICPKEQKLLSLFIISEELKNTVNFYKHTSEDNNIGICSIDNDKRTSQNMINDIKKILSDTEKERIDNFLNIINMMNMMNLYKNISKNSSKETDTLSAMKSLLSPEQQDMFEMYSALFNSGQANTNAV